MINSGDKSPDASIINENFVQLRAERDDNGDGRIYHIQFTVSDESRNICNGEVLVTVPHDMNKIAIDSGLLLTIGIFLFILIEPSFSENDWLASVFHVISASTTAGFQFLNLSNLSLYGKILLIVLMLIGGPAFSTAGGIKIARLMLISEKIINKQKFVSNFNDKNTTNNVPPVISATAIQFRIRIQLKNSRKVSINKLILSFL